MQGEISLSYSQNQFTIHMASDNGGVNNSTRFIYQLQGFNDKWIKTSSNNPDITYMSLPSGNYTLCVRMLKDDGTMGEVESRLEISIASPWYFSWWAWLVYLLILLTILFLWKLVPRMMKKLRERRSESQETEQPEPAEESPEEVIEEAVLMDDEDA